ncbi:sensor histidine kinase [Streptomyces qinzhouensis]|uniref:histidine kinase n=1 Tax=Streptomyces qinzhouensis TaxID=2599401 RepID=A0A5B8JAQ1_9ACTN|nr:HAMP domain-containing sensor histidine kinase [Streptomyces qinzhouensis]QDY76951.1 HAMP domain-containing histidine kinase [Streptomyces qinzhouensis]
MAVRRNRPGKQDIRARRLPLRKSLLARLLAVSALVAVCSVAATAWLAAQTTTGAIKREQGRDLAKDAQIYRELLGHAATSRQWDGVERKVTALAAAHDRRIVLVNQRTQLVIVDSSTAKNPPALPETPSALIDPLNTDAALVGATEKASTGTGAGANTGKGGIDPRAVGPFQLPREERKALRDLAEKATACLRRLSFTAEPMTTPSGRSYVRIAGLEPERYQQWCSLDRLAQPTATEEKAVAALNKLSDDCLRGSERSPLPLWLSHGSEGEPRILIGDRKGPIEPTLFPVKLPVPGPAEKTPVPRITITDMKLVPHKVDSVVENCVETARRNQLVSHVAARAELYISDPDGSPTTPGFELSPDDTARIAGVAALVLALTVGASVLAATRLVRPLRALTSAAQLMKDGEATAPVPVRSDNEIGRLAAAFNDMAEHRIRLETQRREMIGDVAHELRTPLSTIRGWLEGAQDGVADLDPAFVSSLLEEAVQLQHIIDDLQDLAQADAGELRLSPAPVRIGELLAQVAAAHAPRAETAGVRLAVTVPDGLPELSADPVRLRQAVGNLVSNAVRHTPGGGTVTLRARAAGTRLTVEVEDTGSGIPAEDLPYVFDRFWRADKSRNRRTGGSGLGLAIVRKLAEAHGGSASARSTAGEGSVFTLELPVAGPPAR